MAAQAMTVHPVLPWWLLLPLMAAAVLFLGWRLVLVLRPGPAGKRESRRDWLLRSAVVLLLLVAALRPGIPGGAAQAAAADVNVFFVVDTTSSIAAEDYDGSSPRLEGVRRDIMAIAGELAGARFSLISFDTNAAVRMPLTTDTTALDTMVSVLEPQVTAYSKGSSVTVAAKVLKERLTAARESHPERPRIVYYLGDGEQTSGKKPEAMRVDAGLVDGGAVLGYGTPEGGRMKENTGRGSGHDLGSDQDAGAGYIQDLSAGGSGDALSVIDEGRLREIAGELGVPYVHRSAGDPVPPMLQDAGPPALERALQRAEENGSLEGRTEFYWILAAGAFLLALRETVLVVRQWRQLRPAKRIHPARRLRHSEGAPK
jgi:Ca-activated chloride channel family protein